MAWIGALATFGVSGTWQLSHLREDYRGAADAFLLLFFAMYVAITLLLARQPRLQGSGAQGQAALRNPLSSSLVFGVPLAVLPLHLRLMQGLPYADWISGFSALGFGLFYLLIARQLRVQPALALLIQALAALGLIFASLAVPLAFDATATAGLWAIEGAGIAWLGVQQNRGLLRAFGVLLLVLGGLNLFQNLGTHGGRVLLNAVAIARFLAGGASLFVAQTLYRQRAQLRPMEAGVGAALLFWGTGWLAYAGLAETMDQAWGYGAALAWLAALTPALFYWGKRLGWPLTQQLALGIAALSLGVMLTAGPRDLLAEGGGLAWPLMLAAYWHLLYRLRDTPAVLPAQPRAVLHAWGAWQLGLLASAILNYQLAWERAHYASMAVVVLLLFASCGRRPAWPLVAERQAYVLLAGSVLVALNVSGLLWLNLAFSEHPSPAFWLPLLNPQDLLSLAALLALARWRLQLLALGAVLPAVAPANHKNLATALTAVLALLAWVWASCLLLRSVHYWAEVSWADLPQSMLAHTALSLFWSVLGLSLMLAGGKRGSRILWLAGAALMVLVVAKLFLVDLSGSGTLWRVFSFLGVGVLLLIAGYFSPLPPRRPEPYSDPSQAPPLPEQQP